MRTISFCLIAALGTILAGEPVDAAEWYARSSVSQALEYDDNIGLDSSDDEKVSSWGSTSTANLNLGGRARNGGIYLNSSFDYSYFEADTALDSADQRIVLGGTYETERAFWGLEGELVRDTTRTSDADDTGLFILANKRRQLYRVGSNWSYRLSPIDTFSMYGNYDSVSRQTKDLDSYSQITAGFGLARQLTARTQVRADFSGFNFQTDARGSRETNTLNFTIGGTHDFSERWQASLSAGPRYAWIGGTVRSGSQDMRQRTSDSDDSAGYVLNANVRYEAGERTAMVANASHGIAPSTSTGVIRQNTVFGLFINHELLEKVAVDLSGRYSIQENVAGGNDARRHFVSVSPGVRWRISENLTLGCSYRFRWQRYDEGGDSANSNAIFATLSYQLPRLSASR